MLIVVHQDHLNYNRGHVYPTEFQGTNLNQ